MNIVFLVHPTFLNSQSMPRYADWIMNGMAERGHKTEVWTPRANVYNWPVAKKLKKWMGYVDQYILFPQEIKRKITQLPKDTLFVVTDHALGIWVPYITNKPHIIHCHDFLAQRSALGEIAENPVNWTGRQYQKLIRQGYSTGKNFISVSKTTQTDLHNFLKAKPFVSEIVYNGLTRQFSPVKDDVALRSALQKELDIDLSNGYLLHVGGNQWYKNRRGVIELFNVWRQTTQKRIPLLLVGPAPSEFIYTSYLKSPVKESIHFLEGVSDEFVKRLYAGASMLLFPSLAEGFGWPIVEAMASGCPVITTNEEPMVEISGGAAFLIPRFPADDNEITSWATEVANVVNTILNLSTTKREEIIEAGIKNAQQFNSNIHLDKIEKIYKNILARN